jgi:hypothetical protein
MEFFTKDDMKSVVPYSELEAHAEGGPRFQLSKGNVFLYICFGGDTKDVNVIVRPIFKIMKTKEKQNFVEEEK